MDGWIPEHQQQHNKEQNTAEKRVSVIYRVMEEKRKTRAAAALEQEIKRIKAEEAGKKKN